MVEHRKIKANAGVLSPEKVKCQEDGPRKLKLCCNERRGRRGIREEDENDPWTARAKAKKARSKRGCVGVIKGR